MFPLFSRNIKDDADKDFLRTCIYNDSSEYGLYCPIFTLGQIIRMANDTEEFYQEVSTYVSNVAEHI